MRLCVSTHRPPPLPRCRPRHCHFNCLSARCETHPSTPSSKPEILLTEAGLWLNFLLSKFQVLVYIFFSADIEMTAACFMTVTRSTEDVAGRTFLGRVGTYSPEIFLKNKNQQNFFSEIKKMLQLAKNFSSIKQSNSYLIKIFPAFIY